MTTMGVDRIGFEHRNGDGSVLRWMWMWELMLMLE
jgi:hypothetical protein